MWTRSCFLCFPDGRHRFEVPPRGLLLVLPGQSNSYVPVLGSLITHVPMRVASGLCHPIQLRVTHV